MLEHELNELQLSQAIQQRKMLQAYILLTTRHIKNITECHFSSVIHSGYVPLLKELMKFPAHTQFLEADNFNLLHMAIALGKVEVVKTLLESPTMTRSMWKMGNTLLMTAINAKQSDMLKYLLTLNASLYFLSLNEAEAYRKAQQENFCINEVSHALFRALPVQPNNKKRKSLSPVADSNSDNDMIMNDIMDDEMTDSTVEELSQAALCPPFKKRKMY